MEVNGDQKLSGYPHSSKYIIYCVKRKELIQILNNLKVSHWWQNFCLKYLLKVS